MENKKINREPFDEYLIHLKIERGLADNSVESYERDINQYMNFLEAQNIIDWDKIDRYDIILFLQHLKNEDKSDNSIIRMTSSLRQFHQFLRREKVTTNEPMQYVQTPKKAEVLPKVMSMKEVERLLETPDVETDIGLRDRAILEVMYATGLRISELVHLRMDELHLAMGFIQTVGKGNKERIIPIGGEASRWLEEYLCFLEHKGKWIISSRGLEELEKDCPTSRNKAKCYPTYVTSFFCNPFIRKWGGFENCSRIVRAFGHFNDPNLYTHYEGSYEECV